MSELTITLSGEIRESNFEEWKNGLVERIRAVDIDLASDDDFSSANDSVRQFREAERTLRAAKQAALEQAADINRLFDAVDEATEEARQARLALERKIRARRHELRQKELEAHAEANAAALDALPAEHRALFQDRASLLALPAAELEATIEHRVGVWRSVVDGTSRDEPLGDRGGEGAVELSADVRAVPTEGVDGGGTDDVGGGESGAASSGGAVDAAAVRAWRVTIDLRAPRDAADRIFARVRDRWKADKSVTGVDVAALD